MRIALHGKMYAGKTYRARELQKQGYYLINFTDVLKRRACDALNACGTPTTLDDILGSKERYRPFLQELGSLIGFDDEQKYVREACEGWFRACDGAGSDEFCPDAVFDNVRTPAQWAVLRDMGFVLVEVKVDEELRVKRAECMGVSRSDLLKIGEHPIETGLSL